MAPEENFVEKYGPWALIVGASAGLGACFAEECARRGMNVAVCARRMEKLNSVAAALREKYGVETRQIAADISKPDCAKNVWEQVSGLDVGLLIYNAATEPGGEFIRIRLEDHLTNITGNCATSTELVWQAARSMAKKKRGGIYIVSSMAGLGGIPFWATYGAAKGYELILAESLWYEMRSYGVDAAAYVVGATETPNFKETQDIHGTGLTRESETVDPDKLPRTPESVAANLFRQLGGGPRLFSHPDDAERAAQMAMAPRKDYVEAMGQATSAFFVGGANELLPPVE